MSDNALTPSVWVEVARSRLPQSMGLTDWYDGTTHPARPGIYERHFTDSMSIGMASMQYWDGRQWLIRGTDKPHWRQVGDYPAWRGLTEEQHFLQMTGLAA
jgi:hypothetical protein